MIPNFIQRYSEQTKEVRKALRKDFNGLKQGEQMPQGHYVITLKRFNPLNGSPLQPIVFSTTATEVDEAIKKVEATLKDLKELRKDVK